MNLKIKADIALIFVTLTWGISYLLTQNTIENIEVFNFLAVRFSIGFIVSSLIFYKKMFKLDWKMIKYGFIVGTTLFLGFANQTIGLQYTTTSNSAFITGIAVVLVPLLAAVFFNERIRREVVFGVILASVGLGFLTLNDINGLNIGDVLTLIGAVAFAMHIILVGYYTVKTESIQFAIMQIGTVAALSWMTSIIFETPSLNFSRNSWLSMLFLGAFCTSLAFIMQTIAQRHTTSTHTALIYANEPVFAAMFGYLLVGEILGARGILGATLILLGMLVSEIDIKKIIK
ncbi:MAG: DMT family transporter [Clostridiales bacterium]|nr:DMT family transporter [Clostridiales bacterium]